jgi:hypothetical protein
MGEKERRSAADLVVLRSRHGTATGLALWRSICAIYVADAARAENGSRMKIATFNVNGVMGGCRCCCAGWPKPNRTLSVCRN